MPKIKKCKTLLFISLLIGATATPVIATEVPDAQQLFKKKCSLCHSVDKKKVGPAVKTMSQEAEVLRKAITKGRNAMPSYESKLTGEQVDALVAYLLAKQ